MRRLAALLIITGILAAGYPLGQRAYTWYWQQRALSVWDEGTNKEAAGAAVSPKAEEPQSEGPVPIGVLMIDRIDLRLPILDGMDGDKLWVGAGLAEEGAPPGAEGHTILAAHHVHDYGRLFNRLDELRKGDEVVIETRSGRYRYRVYDREVVHPGALTFAVEPGESLLSMVTCDHSAKRINAPDQLVVRARVMQKITHG